MRTAPVFALTFASAFSLLAQTPQQLAQRAAIAAQISGLPVASTDSLTAAEIEAALDLPPGTSTATTSSGNMAQFAAPNTLGIISPRAGANFLLLSSGVAGTNAPEPGTGFGNFGGSLGNDTATVSLTFVVPAGATTLSFDFRFFSAEYPDFVLAGFNDTFSAVLTTPAGTQQLARDRAGRPINVDSVSFFPAFTSIAGGTGFDIFAPNPSGVNYSFPGGLPDAGLTDWISAKGTVTPGSTVTIVFGIADIGDDILDSAVLIDNLRFSSLEVLDGGDAAFRQGNDLTTDTTRLSAGGEARVGICADGVARLLLRMNLPGPGTVAFAINGFVSTGESGALGNPGAAPGGATLNVNSVLTPNGHKAFAVFHAPLNFVRGAVAADQNARTRTLALGTTFTPLAGAPQNGTTNLIIERPPVVLCHGLWSNPATWNSFNPLLSGGLFDVHRVDYSRNNAGRISVNRFQVRNVSNQARAAKQRRGIASAQVDWIGHSMGGLLARSFAATGFFNRPDNFGRGDLHKLITVNTPHWGSPMANLLVGIRETWFLGDLLVIGMEELGMGVVGGAIDDLAEGSAALRAIGTTAVRTHAIGGIGGSQTIGVANIALSTAATLAPPPYSGVFRLLRFLSSATTATLYRTQEHDFIVLLPSQLGGLAAATTTTFGGIGSIHTSIPSHAPASSRCVALLNAATTGVDFAATVPPPNPAPPGGQDPGGPSPAPPGQGISFTTVPGPVSPGGTVTVTVVPYGGYAPTQVLFMASSQLFQVDSSPPFTVNIPVPLQSIGTFTVAAVSENATQQVAGAGPLQFPVNLTATLTGISVFTDRIYLSTPGASTPITVMGSYSDGVQRNITAATLGTTFQSSVPGVATISASGVVTAVGEGSAAIVVQNGAFEVSLGVFVAWEPDVSYSGEGCPTTFGVPLIGTNGGAPVIGNLGFQLTASNLPQPGTGFGFFLLKIGAAAPIGTPITGAPTCVLVYVQPIAQRMVAPNAARTAMMPLAIPANEALAGLPIAFQLLTWDTAMLGSPLPLGSSNAIDLVIGH